MANQKQQNNEFQILTCRLNDLDMALRVEDVQEVLLEGEFKPIPLAPDFISGLFTLRGQIVTGINLKMRFSLPDNGSEEKAIIIIKKGVETLGFIVDEVGDVITVSEDQLEYLPANLKKNWQQWGAKVVRTGEQLVLLMDTEMVIENKTNVKQQEIH